MSDRPVVIVGAGLAGLRCAGLLEQAGVEVTVFEASDGVGGRARTDEVEGFRLDRGFQVLLTAYPEAQRAFDYDSLDLGAFRSGALIEVPHGFSNFADPLREPAAAWSTLVSPAAKLGDKLRLAGMRRQLTPPSAERVTERPQVRTIESLEQRGFSSRVIESFFRPFFGGVLIDPDLVTSSALTDLFFGYFAAGDAALPAGGMGALADQLAGRLSPGTLELDSPVTGVDRGEVRLAGDRTVQAVAVVVATDELAASRLTGVEPPARNRVTTCLYFDVPGELPHSQSLRLSSPGGGPINEVAVPSAVADGYAPPGRSLVSASARGHDAERPDLLEAAVDQLGGWFGADEVSRWRHLATRKIEYALPDFPPGRFTAEGSDPRLDSGIFICGDYRESPSIQGALVSGRKAAEAVITQLARSGERTAAR